MGRAFWVVLVGSLLALGSVASAWACSCMSPATADEAMNKSAAVFFGTVMTIVPLDGSYPIQIEEPVAVTFLVRESWKGPQTPTITLYTVINGMSCEGYFWKEQAAFLVYAHRAADGRLAVGLCSRTAEAVEAAADLRVLGAGQVPLPNDIPAGTTEIAPRVARFPWLVVLGGVVGVSGIALLVFRQRRRRPSNQEETR